MYQLQDDSDVRAVKISELGFAADQDQKGCTLRRVISRKTFDSDNHTSASASDGDSTACKESAADGVEGGFFACSNMQHALALSAFWHNNRCSSLVHANELWRGYMSNLREQFGRSRLHWDEVQALFSVEQ